MDIIRLEKKYSESQNFLNEPSSNRRKLLRIFEFFNDLLSYSNANLVEVYTAELFSKYLSLIKSIKIRGLNPSTLSSVQEQLMRLSNFDFLISYGTEVSETLSILKNKYDLLSSWLNGNASGSEQNIIYFPVLEKFDSSQEIGFLEILRVGIVDGENKFIIEPLESENDEQLQKQLHLCWENAIKYCSKFIKKIKISHTVELKFENRLGVYVGKSLGIALTLAFIDAILKHYNSKTIVNINGCIAVTGGIDENTNIISTSRAIIETKVETVFFSDAQIFCVPKVDEMWAEEKLKELKKHFPKRNLRIIGLTDLDDLLDRRQIVDIRKQKFVVRSGKFVKKNWLSSVATVLLSILFAYLFVMDWDDNPASLTTDGNLLFVRNKNGNVLWTTKVGFSKDAITDQKLLGVFCRLYDIDFDGDNEILISNELLSKENSNTSRAQLICYDKKNTKLWSYSFTDSVESEREILKPYYSILLVDTLTIGGIKNLFLISTNSPSFSSAIYRIDIRTGKRLPGTLWTSGHTVDAMIKDVNNDNKKDILAIGLDNGYEEQVVFAFQIDSLTKVRPSTKNYTIKNFTLAELISYVRIPKTDFAKSKNTRMSGIDRGTLIDETFENLYRWIIMVNDRLEDGSIWVKLDYNLKDFDFVIGDQFRVNRDSLVAKGKLSPPYTDTQEYKNIIKSNILYWKDGKWVKRKDLD